MRRWVGRSHQLGTEARNGARACSGTQAGRRGLAAGAAHRHALHPAQARGDGRPGADGHRRPGRAPPGAAISSPGIASRPGCSRSTSVPPTGASRTTSTDCWPAAAFPEPVRLPARRSSWIITGSRASCRCPWTPTRGTTSWCRAIASTTACSTTRSTIAAPRRASFTSPRAAFRFPPTRRACRSRRSCGCFRRRCGPPPRSCACRSRRTGRSRWRRWCRCCCGHWCVPRCRRCRRRSGWRCGSSCPAGWCRTSTSWRASSATRAIHTCRGTTPALDVEGWTGHSGCVILAPHLTRLRKKDLGLPHVSAATEAERAAGMCWASESELYNNGSPFKITSRGMDGVMVTILADNYFGYCKKEVKTQIGYSANLFGLAEEEHAGGALAFPTFNLGDRFVPDLVRIVSANHRFAEVRALLGGRAKFHDSGYATDAIYPEIHYMPEDMEIDVHQPGYQVDEQRAGTAPQAVARPDLHSPERLQDPDGQAPGRAELAPDRDRPGGRLLPQAVHGVGRREVGDQQESGRCRAARVLSTCGASRTTWRWCRRSSTGATTTRSCPSSAPATVAARHGPSCLPIGRSARSSSCSSPIPPSSRRNTTPGWRAFRTTSARWCS